MTLPLKKRMEVINQKLVDEKKLRKYEVEIQIKKTEIYHITAKDDADLIIAKFGERPSLVASISSITISSIPH